MTEVTVFGTGPAAVSCVLMRRFWSAESGGSRFA